MAFGRRQRPLAYEALAYAVTEDLAGPEIAAGHTSRSVTARVAALSCPTANPT